MALLVLTSATSVAASIDDLLRAYPDALAGFDGASLIWRDGTRMPVGDGRPDKSMEEQLGTAPSLTNCDWHTRQARRFCRRRKDPGPCAKQSVFRQDVW